MRTRCESVFYYPLGVLIVVFRWLNPSDRNCVLHVYEEEQCMGIIWLSIYFQTSEAHRFYKRGASILRSRCRSDGEGFTICRRSFRSIFYHLHFFSVFRLSTSVNHLISIQIVTHKVPSYISVCGNNFIHSYTCIICIWGLPGLTRKLL